jgi:hypothetical protein
VQCSCQALPLGRAQMRCLLEGLVGLLRQHGNGAATFSQLRCCLAC